MDRTSVTDLRGHTAAPGRSAGGVDHDERTRTATHSHAHPLGPQPQRRDARAAAARGATTTMPVARGAPAPHPESGLPVGCSHPRPASGCLQWTDDYSACAVGRSLKLRSPRGARLRSAAPCSYRVVRPGIPSCSPVPLRRPEGEDPADPIEIHGRIQAGPHPAPGDDQFSPWYGISDSLHATAVHPFVQALQSCAWTAVLFA